MMTSLKILLSGDGFAVGFVKGLMEDKGPQEAVNLGWVVGTLVTTFPGDQTMEAEVRIFANECS